MSLNRNRQASFRLARSVHRSSLHALASCLILLCMTHASAADSAAHIVVVIGAHGTEKYGEEFSQWAEYWRSVATESGTSIDVIGDSADSSSRSDHESLKSLMEKSSVESNAPLWLILIGHGTYARATAKFNLRGPDVSAKELSEWLGKPNRPVVVVNCASSSGPFINRLSGPNRVIVSATKSGTEQNYARFGKYFAEAILSPKSDLDHDDEVSVQEAFLQASAAVQDFYDNASRISTEHALIDDNGDGRGTPAKMFRGVRAIASAKDGTELDGKLAKRITLAPVKNQLRLNAKQQQQRDKIESQLDRLRQQKDQFSEQEYQDQIEPLMMELAKLYRAAERAKAD